MVRNKCAASYTILVLADYYPFNREQTFDIDDVTSTREKKKPIHSLQKSLLAKQKRQQLVCFHSFSLSSISTVFSIEVAHEGEIKAHRGTRYRKRILYTAVRQVCQAVEA